MTLLRDRYMAPEVVDSSVAYNMKCDMWSIGIGTMQLGERRRVKCIRMAN